MHPRIKIATWAAIVGVIATGLSQWATRTGPAEEGESPATQRIVGGTEVPRGKYPFMASLRFDQRHFCGGSLYDSETIITAAHCVKDITDASASRYSVAIGQTLLSDTVGVRQRGIRAVRISAAKGSDLATVTLDGPVEGIAPIELPPSNDRTLYGPGQMATVMGWGNTNPYVPSIAQELREVEVPIVPKGKCAIVYPNNDLSTYFCAGVGGKDSCQGDSGGPIMQGSGDRVYQIGVVSFGAGCAQPNAPGVYADLSSKELWNSLGVAWQRDAVQQVPVRR